MMARGEKEEAEVPLATLLALLPPRKRPPHLEQKLTPRIIANYFATGLATFLLSVSIVLLAILTPIWGEPAVTSLLANFVPEPVTCVTSRVETLSGFGINNPCIKASCRQACTVELYKCKQIYVNVSLKSWHDFNSSLTPLYNVLLLPTSSTTKNPFNFGELVFEVRGKRSADQQPTAMKQRGRGRHEERRSYKTKQVSSTTQVPIKIEKWSITETVAWNYTNFLLLPNVKGCGYPPTVNCSVFYSFSSFVGSAYPCYVSQRDPTYAVTTFSERNALFNIYVCLVTPGVTALLSSAYLIAKHFPKSCFWRKDRIYEAIGVVPDAFCEEKQNVGLTSNGVNR